MGDAMSADAEDALTEMLCRAFPLATGEQLVRGTEQFRKIIDSERRQSAAVVRVAASWLLRRHGYNAAADLLQELPYD